jgi:MoaA/NifB/PqqE/SkfB family radical SAM enzyme
LNQIINKIDTVMVETSGICNLRCIMCPTNEYSHNKNIMEDSVFEKVLNFIADPNIKTIQMYGWGEPLLDPKLSVRIRQAKQINPRAYIAISSNGTLFTSQKINQILESGLDQINISFDAGSKEVYEKIRVNSNFKRTIENLRGLSSKRSKNKTSLWAIYVVLKENVNDMERAVKLFYELGFDSITFTPHTVPFSKNALQEASFGNSARSECLRLKKEWENKFSVNECGFSIDHELNDCYCRVTHGSIFINSLGDVSPCCMLSHHLPIYQKGLFAKKRDCYFSAGNITLNNIGEILTGDKYNNFIQMFLNSHLPDPCKGCRIVNLSLLHKVESEL